MVAVRFLAGALATLFTGAISSPTTRSARGPAAAASGALVPVKKAAQPAASPLSSGGEPVVYSIGDLHGDYERFKLILDSLGLASFQPLYSARGVVLGDVAKWTGGRSILVSTGDTVDRGDHSKLIFDLFITLRREAAAAGGEVVNILGNHDLMNIMGDFEYVSNAELDTRGDYGGPQARKREFSSLGTIGKDIRTNYVVAAVRGDTLFVHAGLDPMWLRQSGSSLDAMNRRVRAMINQPIIPNNEPILKTDGPLWDRKFADKDPRACGLVEETLRLVGAKRMVVGHTIQPNGVEVWCPSPSGPRIVLADTAISRAYGAFGKASAVEYKAGAVTAMYFKSPKGMAPELVPLVSPPQQFQLPMPAHSHRGLEPVAKQSQPQFHLPPLQGSAGAASEPWLWQSQGFESALPEVVTTLARPQLSPENAKVQKKPEPPQLKQVQKKPEPPQLSKQDQQQQKQQKQQQHRNWLTNVVSGARTPPTNAPTLQPPPDFQDAASSTNSMNQFALPQVNAFAYPAFGSYSF